MRHCGLLFLVRLQGFRNAARTFRSSDLPANGASILVFGGFAVGMFLLSRTCSLYLLNHAHVGLFLMHRLLSMVLYVLFITVNLGNVVVFYATFYRSEEVAFLMAMPIRQERIFLVKFFDNIVSSSLTLVLIGVALVSGYLSAFPLPWHVYLSSVLFVLLPLMLLASILAIGILLGLVAVASRLGARRLLALTILVYVGAVYLYFKLTNPEQFLTMVVKRFPVVNAYFSSEDPPFVGLLPSHWVSQYLYWTIMGKGGQAAAYLLTLWGATCVAGSALWLLARKVYYRSWLAASLESPVPVPRTRSRGIPFLRLERHSIGSRQTDVVLKRDFWMFFREPGQWVHLMLMGVLLGVFLTSVSSLDVPWSQPVARTVSFLTLLMFNGFLLASIALRFVFPAVSLEGDAFWCLRSAPIDLGSLYRRKFFGSFVPILAAAQVLSAVSAGLTREVFFLIVAGTVTMGCVAFAMTGLHLGAGSVFAQFHEKNPVRVASSRGATLTFFLSMVYLMMVTVILALPVYRFFETMSRTGSTSPGWMYIPLAAIAGLSLIVTTMSTMVGVRSFGRDH